VARKRGREAWKHGGRGLRGVFTAEETGAETEPRGSGKTPAWKCQAGYPSGQRTRSVRLEVDGEKTQMQRRRLGHAIRGHGESGGRAERPGDGDKFTNHALEIRGRGTRGPGGSQSRPYDRPPRGRELERGYESLKAKRGASPPGLPVSSCNLAVRSSRWNCYMLPLVLAVACG
jgi:hypothetical protein